MNSREDENDPFDWSTEQVVTAVANGDEQIAKSLLFNEVDGRVLLTVCTYERLKQDIGILPLGKRERIMRTIQGLRKISRRFDEYILEIAAATSLPDGPDNLEPDTCLALSPPSLDPPSFDPLSARNPLASPKGTETPKTPAIRSPAIFDPLETKPPPKTPAIRSPAIFDPLETKPPRSPAPGPDVFIKTLGIPPLPSPISRKRKASGTLGKSPARQARNAEARTSRDGCRTPPAQAKKLLNLISRRPGAMPLIVHDPFSEFKVQESPVIPAVRIEQPDEFSVGRAVPFCIKAHPEVPPLGEIGHGDEMDVDDEPVGIKSLPSPPGEQAEGADCGRWEVTHEEITVERLEEQPEKHLEEIPPAAPSPEGSNARKGRYLPLKGLEVDEIFYGDVKVGDQIHAYDSDHDDFCITSWSQPVGLQMTVNRQIYRFLQNPERTTTVSRAGHLRVGIKPYKERFVLKHHLPSCTVYDVQPDGTCKVFREDLSTIRLPWSTSSTNAPEPSSETQIVRFMDAPDRPQPILNTQDNSVHDWDYLIKWQNLEGDGVLPVFGDSGSENEDTVAAWNEYQTEYGPREKPLGKTSRRPLSAREVEEALNEGMRQRVAEWCSKFLPRKEAQAFKIWRNAKKRRERKLMAHKSKKRLQELDDRLKKQKAEISGMAWWTKDAVKKQTKSMTLTVNDREESKWLINLMERRIAPEKPKDVRVTGGEIPQDSEEGDDEESQGSDSEADSTSDGDSDMEGFIVADTERDFLNGQELEVEGEKEVEQEMRLKAQEEEKLIDSDSSAEEEDEQPPRRSRRRVAGGGDGDDNQEMDLDEDRGDKTEGGAMANVAGDRAVEESDGEFQDITESLVDKGKEDPKSVSSSAGAVKAETAFPSSTPSKNASIPIIDLTLDDSPTERPSQQIEISTEDDEPWPGENSNKLLVRLVNETETVMKAGIYYRLEDYKLSTLFSLVVSVARQFNVPRIKNVEGLDHYNAQIYRMITSLYVSWVFGKEIRPIRKLSSDEIRALDVQAKFKEFRMLLKQLTSIANANTAGETEDESVSGASGHGRSGIVGRKGPTSEPKPEPPMGHRKRRQAVVEEDQNAKASRDRAHKIHKNIRARIRNQEKKGDKTGGKIAINLGRYSKQKDIFFHPHLAENLKPHQIEGTRFLWQQLVQTGEGRGALLAHTMGLGKTLQVIALLYTLATAGASEDSTVFEQIPENLRESRTLILSPPGLVENWWDEFHKWIPQKDDDPNQLDLAATGQILKADSTVTMSERLRTINEWYTDGGVLLMGYATFRNLVDTKIRATIFGATTQISRGQQKTIQEMLLEGPSIIVADEAHQLKNHDAQISQAARGFRSMSRIAMTGSPLSNNLLEYWTMIDWIDPGFLGPRKEFQLKFVDPIQDGLYADSNFQEKRRCLKMLNVLKNDIGPKIHRADIGAIKKDLPPKTEFMVKVPLTPFQVEMYTRYVTDPVTTGGIEPSNGKARASIRFFDIIHLLSLICNHPMCFVRTLEEREDKRQAVVKKHRLSRDETFLTEDEDLQELIDLDGDPAPNEELLCEANQPYPWATEIIKTVENPRSLEHSNKMVALKIIVEHSILVGDQVLIFSHGVYTLNYLEALLIEWKVKYLRLDGKTRMDVRQSSTKTFNAGGVDVFLVSTEAGGLGLNLPGANRVIVFDFKWSPMWEEQAVGRAYRLGQKKHVWVYRFHAVGTFEELKRNKILFKSQLQSRVVDKRDPLRLATKDLRQYLRLPQDVPREDISEYKGKDLVLDEVLDRVGFISGISYSETFQRDPEDTLTEEELRETAQLLKEAQRLRKDPEYRQKLQEDTPRKNQAEQDPVHLQKLQETYEKLREESLRNTMSGVDPAPLQMARELEIHVARDTRFAGNPIVPSSMRPLPITQCIPSDSAPPAADRGSSVITTNPATSVDSRLVTPITPVIPAPQSPSSVNRFNLNLKALPKMNLPGPKNITTGQDHGGER